MAKAQAAMEFLMTYGWAVFVLLGMVFALSYFGVFSPVRFLPEQCSFPAGFACVDRPFMSSSGGNVDFAVRNGFGHAVNITGLLDDGGSDDCSSPAISGCRGIGCSPLPLNSSGLVANEGQVVILRVSCSSVPPGRFKVDPDIVYVSTASGLQTSVRGTIVGAAQ